MVMTGTGRVPGIPSAPFMHDTPEQVTWEMHRAQLVKPSGQWLQVCMGVGESSGRKSVSHWAFGPDGRISCN